MCSKPTRAPRAPCRWFPRSATFRWPASPRNSCSAANWPTLKLQAKKIPHFGVKEAVLPFNMFPEVDPVLGPEMRSTGEVLGMADSFGMAFFKAEEAATPPLPLQGTVLITVSDREKDGLAEVAREFVQLGFKVLATQGTQQFLAERGIKAEPIKKMHEGRPHIVDAVKSGEIQLIINTPAGKQSQHDDSYIRKNAIKYKIPYVTTVAAARAAAKGIAAMRKGHISVKSLQAYHQDILNSPPA